MRTQTPLNRGAFIRLTGAVGAGLVLAFCVPARAPTASGGVAGAFEPNAWVRINPDDTVTVMISKAEMGQGVTTGLPTILADELDASIDQVKYEFAPVDPRLNSPISGQMQTADSTSVKESWLPLRNAGATARAMLVGAAAKQWSVDPSTCTTRDGVVHHAQTNRSATYGSLANAAAALPVPQNVRLKSPDRFTLIGKQQRRLDIAPKVNGGARYGVDVRVPGMLYAAIARSPVLGGQVKTFDGSKARAIAGVLHVVQISNGVAVVAKNTFAAFQGKYALQIDWDDGPNAAVSDRSLLAQAERLAKAHVGERVAITRGSPDTVDGTVLEATYRGPFLAHTTMEPQNATAHVREDRCDVWAPTQVQTHSQAVAAEVTGLPAEQCVVHTTLLGGGFGRRLEWDYVREAVEVSKAVKAPVKVTWTREDDIQHDFYRPLSVNVVRGVLKGGTLSALSHQIVQKSWRPETLKNGVDVFAVTEAIDIPYRPPNFRVTYINHEHGIPVGLLRGPHASWNAFVTETFIDDLAHRAGKDPLAFRLELLQEAPRPAAVLRLAAQKAGWGEKKPPGIAQGLAVTYWNGSYCAMVADVSMRESMPTVHRVVAAVDCGTVINPDIVVQQVQGGANYGLSAALTGRITLQNGRVQQNNFNDYTVLRLADAPTIDVSIIASSESPSGIGEVGTPPIAPAVGNALFVLTGKRLRQLPFSEGLS